MFGHEHVIFHKLLKIVIFSYEHATLSFVTDSFREFSEAHKIKMKIYITISTESYNKLLLLSHK